MQAVPTRLNPRREYTRAIASLPAEMNTVSDAALDRVLDQRAGDRAAEALTAHGGQRGDADDLAHALDRLVRPGGRRAVFGLGDDHHRQAAAHPLAQEVPGRPSSTAASRSFTPSGPVAVPGGAETDVAHGGGGGERRVVGVEHP